MATDEKKRCVSSVSYSLAEKEIKGGNQVGLRLNTRRPSR